MVIGGANRGMIGGQDRENHTAGGHGNPPTQMGYGGGQGNPPLRDRRKCKGGFRNARDVAAGMETCPTGSAEM